MIEPTPYYPIGSPEDDEAKRLREIHAEGTRNLWISRLRRAAKGLGLDPALVYEQLVKQAFHCPICLKEIERVYIDLDTTERRPRGLLCGWCARYVKCIEHDPLRAKAPRRLPERRGRALVYLGCVEPIADASV